MKVQGFGLIIFYIFNGKTFSRDIWTTFQVCSDLYRRIFFNQNTKTVTCPSPVVLSDLWKDSSLLKVVLWWCIHSLLRPLNVPTHTFHPMYVTTQVHFVHYVIVTNPHIVPEFIVHPGNGGSLGWTNSMSTFYVTHRPMYFLSTLGRNVTTLRCRKHYVSQWYIS